MSLYIKKHIRLSFKNLDEITGFYRLLQVDYPKFFKMDGLSKLGFLASEMLLTDTENRFTPREDVAIICFNRSSSLEIDTQYQATIADNENYFPSPSLFVYTLPNIVTGEISIRNSFFGETSFYICKEFDVRQIAGIVKETFLDKTTTTVLVAWIEDWEETHEVFMALIENENGEMEFTEKQFKNKNNMKRFFFKSLCLMALFPLAGLFAQEDQTIKKHHNLKLAFEVGTNVTSADLVKPEQIRENHSAGYYYSEDYMYYCGLFGDNNFLSTTYVGVKPEYFIFKNRIGIASGLRFTISPSKLVSDGDNFLWRVNENDLNTEYVRINSIHHKSYLLGIPLEIRYFINRRELPVQTYFKIGTSFNWRIHSKNQVNFTNKAMEEYDDLVQNQLPKNNLFSSFFYGAVGFKIGKYREGCWSSWGNIEFQFPYLRLTDKSFLFTGGPGLGGGIQLSLQIPLGKNVPIGSN